MILYVVVVFCQLLVYNDNKNNIDRWLVMKKWILAHRKIVTTVIIVFAVLSIIITSFLFWFFQKQKMKSIELLYYNSQIISSIFVISGVVIAVWQYYLSYIDSKRNMDVICVQKAIDLSEYYKDNILSYSAPIRYIFDNSGITKIISKIDVSKIKHFDQKELYTFLNEKDIDSLKEIQKSNKFFSVVINANAIYNLGINKDLIILYKKKNLSKIDEKIFSTFLGKLIIRVLNNMEFFSLHFTHNVADESVVYKSLHQTYINIVQILYYHIANRNPLSTTKYFTNIIELYELWNERSINDEELFTSGLRNLSNKGTVVENKQ